MSGLPIVENPIINSAFEEPRYRWIIKKGETPRRVAGRRTAGYYFRIPEGAARGRARQPRQGEIFDSDSPGEWQELVAVSQIRLRLQHWRERGYQGATRITQELLALWNDSENRQEALFFAQREAVESVIFMVEGPRDLLQGLPEMIQLDKPSPALTLEKGYRAFLRYALKMATGTGKTTVMAMLAAWSILNRRHRPDDDRFSDTVLIVCPNVTIRDRLQELDPAIGKESLYVKRELVPESLLPELRCGDVIVTNWHRLALQEMKDVNGVNARVVKRGVPVKRIVTRTIDGEKVEIEETQYLESDEAFVKDRIFKGRKGRSPAILVLNDEAHHAYRRASTEDPEFALDRAMAQANDREATVWIEGLDRINKVLGGRAKNGIRLCVDLSATPFFIQGSGQEVGKAFPWIISDFGLLDAIEAGMVKIPMLPSADMTGSERPAYFNIWRWVQEQLGAEGITGEPSPKDMMRFAVNPMTLLAQKWEETAEQWAKDFAEKRRKSPAPPVFIVVCRDTALAKEVYAWLAEGKKDYGPAPACFRNAPGRPVTVRIDSKVAEDIESGAGGDEARRLRFVLETVGKQAWPGGAVPPEYAAIIAKHNAKAAEDDSDLPLIDPATPPGRDIRCIISVAMLSEGWDATTVTHVVGLRPFGSQLLCEQVMGRALRRTHYSKDEKGLLIAEEAEVLGVPFELIPLKVSKSHSTEEATIHHVFPVEAKAELEITFPVVVGYDDPGYAGVKIEWERVPTLDLNPQTVPDSGLLRPMVTHDGNLLPFGPGKTDKFDLSEWRGEVREQGVAFLIATLATQRVIEEHGDTVPAHRLFPQLLGYARLLVQTKVNPMGERQRVDVALNPYLDRAVEALCGALVPVSRERSESERPRIPSGSAGTRSTAGVNFFTTRKVWGTVSKCHLNLCVADTEKWEQSAAYCLDIHPAVAAWVKNDHLGLLIRYRKAGRLHNYVPDFIIRLADGRILIVEVKGQLGDAETKQAAALRWVAAVNRERRYGEWSYHLARQPPDLMVLLNTLSGQSPDLPFME